MSAIFNHLLLLSVLAFALQSYTQPVAAQTRYSTSRFQGSWHWEHYLTSQDLQDSDIEQLRRWAEGMDIKKVPFESLHIDLIQRGARLTGKCSSTMRFIDKLDGGSFSTRIRGRAAHFTIESSHGGIVTVELTRRRNRLYWKIIKTEGEGDNWLPNEAILRRVQRK